MSVYLLSMKSTYVESPYALTESLHVLPYRMPFYNLILKSPIPS
jgi:hypothetical protein